MNLLRFIKITFITALISFTATSCLKDDSNEGVTKRKIVAATILLTKDNPDEIHPNKSPFYCLSDEDSTKLYPVNYNELTNVEHLKNNQRYQIEYKKYEAPEINVKSAKEPLLIEITNSRVITTLDILQTLKIDTVVNNIPINPIQKSWYSGGVHGSNVFITIPIEFYAEKFNNTLLINIVDSLKDTTPIEDGYYPLEFRMSGKKNHGYYDELDQRLISISIPEKYRNDINGTEIIGLKITYKQKDGDDEIIKYYPY